jgi:hypothetical protein
MFEPRTDPFRKIAHWLPVTEEMLDDARAMRGYIDGRLRVGVTLASYLIGGKVTEDERRHWLRFLVAFGLTVLIAAAASLDVFYYDRLLRGAVAALIDLEKQNPQLQLSTRIEEVVGLGKYAIRVVYALILLLLAAFTWWAWGEHRRHSLRAAVAVSPTAASPNVRTGSDAI